MAQTNASVNDPYYLSTRGVNSVSFNKQSTPPLAYLNKGILYEMNDGVLYFNGSPLSGGTGDVVGPASSKDNAVTRYDGTTGKIIQDSNLLLGDGGDYLLQLRQYNPGDVASYRFINSDATESNLSVGFNAGPDNLTSSDLSVFYGNYAGNTTGSKSSCTFIGADAGKTIGDAYRITAVGTRAFYLASGDGNTTVGYNSLYNCLTPYNSAYGTESLGQLSIAPNGGIIPCSAYGAWSMKNITKGNGNNSFGWRSLEGSTGVSTTGPQYNNMFGNYNGLSANDGYEFNNCYGNSCLNSCSAGKGNCIFGNSGESYITGTESYNILMGNGTGVNGDSYTIRIGASTDSLVSGVGKPLDCYIQGIHNRSATTAVARKIVAIDSTGKLYGQTIGHANPYYAGSFQDFVSLYVVPIVSTNVAVLANPTLVGLTPGSFFTSSVGTVTYNGTDQVDVKANIQISCRLTSGSNETFEFIPYISGSPVYQARMRMNMLNANFQTITLSYLIPAVNNGATLQLYITNITGVAVLAIGNIYVTYEAKY